MVIVKVFGGMGNQLFCYAAGKALAKRLNVELRLDVYSGFKKDFYLRDLALNNFNIAYKEAGYVTAFKFPLSTKIITLIRWVTKKIPIFRKFYFYEYDISKVDHDFFKIKNHFLIYLDGYWQSEKYFSLIESELRSEFKIIKNHSEVNINFSKIIKSKLSVAVHARRLHGVPNQKNAKPNPNVNSLSKEYYLDAMHKIKKSYPEAHFFCFSDYPQWFRENFNDFENLTIVDINSYGENNTYEDFWLMSQCKHFVISNSTFAWWAAWLSEGKEKMVIAPNKVIWENKDIIPSNWIESSLY
jgi:hypothetical protein